LHRAEHSQRRKSIVRHGDLLILKPEDPGEPFRCIDVVVDHEYAASNRPLPRPAGWGNRRRFGLIASLGQSNDELAAPAETGAAGLDVPAVQLDQTLHERQPDSEAALRTIACFELPEEVEHTVEHPGGKA